MPTFKFAKLVRDRVDFSQYPSANLNDPLIKITGGNKLVIEPYWSLNGNWEGGHYRAYIAEHPEYGGVYLRSEVAKKLTIAAKLLDPQYKLVVRTGHRPAEVQRALLIDCARNYQQEHPEASAAQALDHARLFVSDPDISLPPHVCGAAVDVELIDAATKAPLDFGSSINEDNEKSFLDYPGLSAKQQANRQILQKTMLAAGFASLASEWWHFSYGDQVWAWFYDKKESLYSPIDI